MGTSSDKARAFAALHRPGDPVVLYNAWDAGSALVVAEAGAKAIATGSASVAAAHGFQDAEALPLDLAASGLTAVSQTVNTAGQTVRTVRDRAGQLLEVVTDSAGRIVSSRRMPR